MSRLRVLLVDDDPDFARHFELLAEGLFDVQVTASGSEVQDLVRHEHPDAVLLDVDLGTGPDGIVILDRIRRDDPDLPVIMISGDDSPETIVRAMRAGADDYVSKRPDLELLRLKVERALEQAAWRTHAREMQATSDDGLIGSSAVMERLRDEIRRVGPMKVRVLIRGESGTGKELVARALHAASPRRSEKWVVMSAAVGSDELFDSDLFGHEKGAFTGARERRRGKFELANGGTLFLDEVGKMPLARQAKLLRVVETGRFDRVGSSQEFVADVRLITASNENLKGKIGRDEFLEDLYYRLAEYELWVPPLREHLEDLPGLCEELLSRFATAEGRGRITLDPGAVDPLMDYTWPGNVRELDAVLKRSAILAVDDLLTTETVKAALDVHRRGRGDKAAAESRSAGSSNSFAEFLDDDYTTGRARLQTEFDRLFILKELRRSGGNVTRAAERLGISRATLNRKMAELDLKGFDPGND